MSRVYTVTFSSVAVTAAQDLFEFVAGAAKPVRLRAISLSQSSEVGDAQEEGLAILIKSGQTTSGSGGSAPTPVPVSGVDDSAAGFTAKVNNTTKATAGTIVPHHADNWNVRTPYFLMLPPELCFQITGSRRMTVELVNAPVDSITMSGTAWLEEI